MAKNMLGILPKLTKEDKDILLRVWNWDLKRPDDYAGRFSAIEHEMMFRDANKILKATRKFARTSPIREPEGKLVKKLEGLIDEQGSNPGRPTEADKEPASRDPGSATKSSLQRAYKIHYKSLVVRRDKFSSGV